MNKIIISGNAERLGIKTSQFVYPLSKRSQVGLYCVLSFIIKDLKMIPWEKIFRPSQRIFGTILEVFYYYSEDGELLDSDSRLNTYHLLSNLCWVTVEQGRQKSGASTNPAETQM